MGLLINGVEVTKIELEGVEVLKIEDGQGNVLYEAYSGPDYLCFTAGAANSTIEFSSSAPTLYTSSDRRNWTQWDGSRITLANAGDKLYVYGNNPSGISTQTNWRSFKMTGSIAASGDVTTLITQNGGVTVLPDYCFIELFRGCSSLTSVPSLDSVTRVNQWALVGMFYECTSITESPDLRNATYVGSYGCASMCYGCTALRTIYAPSITTWNTTNFTGWVTGIGGNGTMWKPAALSIPSGNDGKPTGWNTQNYPERSVTITFDTTNGNLIDYETSDGRIGEFIDNIGTLEISESQTVDIITADVYEQLKKNNSFQGCGTDYTYAYADLANGDVFTSVTVTPDCSCWQEQGYANIEVCNCAEFGDCPDPCNEWEERGYESYEDCQCQLYGECGEEPEEEPEEEP